MKWSLHHRHRLVLIGASAGAGFGIAYVIAVGSRTASSVAEGALTGMLIASGIGLLEFMGSAARPRRFLRQLPFVAFILVRTTSWVAWTAAVLLLVPSGLHGTNASPGGGFARAIAYSLVVSLLIVSLLELSRLLGRGTLWKLVTGRYHRPRIEERAFLLFDLVGSTSLAERIGDARFLAFLDRLVCDISEDISAYGGEVYRYVGDATIASWPIDRAVADAAIVRCLFAVAGRLHRERSSYERDFGLSPVVRAALHAGPIVVGEVGDSRREITFLGDTLNTVARIEKACAELGRDAVISGALLTRLTLPAGLRADPLGEVALAGKSRPVALHALAVVTGAAIAGA
ncbi:MAG: adenylate/guanylate cyclase domain-containing protein [Betaproteobacteria bacterium]|nr:adenylate/guanylate cyclase domain-containing protein [Betaproteobacteria bacterium]